MNICTRKVASDEIEKSLSGFLETATSKVETILEKSTEVTFWKPMNRDNVLTFENTKTKSNTTSQKKSIGSAVMFRKIICAAHFQEIDLSNILSYELSSVPTSMPYEDGSMRKSSK